MRILMLVAVLCLAVALLGQVDVFNGVNVLAWAIGGLLCWALDVALGGYVFAGFHTRQPPPAA